MAGITVLGEFACFGGVQGFYQHDSATIGLPMRFGVYRPPQAAQRSAPMLYLLAGLACNEEIFPTKAGAQRYAAEHGLMLITPDTSPRRTGIPGATGEWDVGEGASFYVDAIKPPWSQRFRMERWLTEELPEVVAERFNGRVDRLGVSGHSMGGHGALVLALRNPRRFRSVSAFAPVCSASRAPWGKKAFERYFGSDPEASLSHDAVELVRAGARSAHMLIDVGTKDRFVDEQLMPELLQQVCDASGQPLTLRRQPNYDHSYFFVSSFAADHGVHHAEHLA
jgi:S-formylglutathione hydrolase